MISFALPLEDCNVVGRGWPTLPFIAKPASPGRLLGWRQRMSCYFTGFQLMQLVARARAMTCKDWESGHIVFTRAKAGGLSHAPRSLRPCYSDAVRTPHRFKPAIACSIEQKATIQIYLSRPVLPRRLEPPTLIVTIQQPTPT